MKKSILVLLLCCFQPFVSLAEDANEDLSVDYFQVKLKPGSTIPVARVYNDSPSLISYNKSRSAVLDYALEVRGRCPALSSKLTAFRLEINGQTILDIPVSGNNRSLTGNHGNQWDTYSIRAGFAKNDSNLINACNADAVAQLQSQSHDQVFNANYTTDPFDSGKRVQVYYHCEGGAFFHDVIYDTTALPVRALCEATGYQSKLEVTNAQLSLTPITSQGGSCELTIAGGFQTNYELYAMRSNNSTAELRYRFKYQGQNGGVAYSQWWQKTANPINAGSFVFNYTDRLPSGIQGGSIVLEVDSGHDLYQSNAREFTIDCVDPLPLQQVGNLSLNLSVAADNTELTAIGQQLCPSHGIISGNINAGYGINGNMVVYGNTLVDIHVNPIALEQGESDVFNKRIKLNWPNPSASTLAIGQANTAPELQRLTLNYGMRITNSDNAVVASLPKKPFVISCQYPSVNPGLSGSNTLNMQPDHTGGGGSPTDLANSNQQDTAAVNKAKVLKNAGLRSDGELAQAKKPKHLLAHELTHLPQQGSKVQSDAHDKYANIEAGHQGKKPRTISSDRLSSDSLAAATVPTLYQGKVGDACHKKRFPKNVVILDGKRQIRVECMNRKVQLNKNKAVSVKWKKGGPVLKP